MSAYPAPPYYSPGRMSPDYTPVPSSTERTLERSSAAGPSRIAPTGCFLCRNENISLLLSGQDGSKDRPSIGPGALLDGRVILEGSDLESIRAVELTFDGRLESMPLLGAPSETKVASIYCSLFSSENSCCPRSLPFSIRAPSIFEQGSKMYLLPPSCHIEFHHAQLFVKCTYRITATVLTRNRLPSCFRKKHWQVTHEFWFVGLRAHVWSHSVSVEVDYRIHHEPSAPVSENPSAFLSSIKTCPEDWTQLFLPSSRTFRASDVIPFYIQVSGPIAGLRELFSGGPRAFKHPLRSAANFPIQVYILRRVTMPVGERRARRSLVLGEGLSRPLPPTFHQGVVRNSFTLHWEGELRSTDPSIVGSFDAGAVLVKVYKSFTSVPHLTHRRHQDSIVAEISPPPGSSLRRGFAEQSISVVAAD
ncbi:hypothetical protein FB451DRAFT_1047105 [Mycena latifolia]|nr:hypothetical protein FB451DRAFT_1047105 [Mycena latifolia]